jgi:hypothetical protein
MALSLPAPTTSALTRAACIELAVIALGATALPSAQAAAVSGQGTWETTLQGRDLDDDLANGYEAYYDTALNITWLTDANYASTSNYFAASSLGSMTLADANSWAAHLNFNGVTGWRMPDIKPVNGSSFVYRYSYDGSTDESYNITGTGSELAHLYYVTLGNKSYWDTSGNYQPDSGFKNTGPFSNVQPFGYWYDGGYNAPGGVHGAWLFDTIGGAQFGSRTANSYFAWAVRSGDVLAAVPEPQSTALALVGLIVVLLGSRSKQRYRLVSM